MSLVWLKVCNTSHFSRRKSQSPNNGQQTSTRADFWSRHWLPLALFFSFTDLVLYFAHSRHVPTLRLLPWLLLLCRPLFFHVSEWLFHHCLKVFIQTPPSQWVHHEQSVIPAVVCSPPQHPNPSYPTLLFSVSSSLSNRLLNLPISPL